MCEHEHKKSEIKIRVYVAILLFLLAFVIDTEALKLGLFLIAYLLAGGDVLLAASKHVFEGKIFDENFLMSIATVGAFLIGEYPEAVIVMILYQTGEYLQHRAVERSRKSIKELMNIRPDYANVLNNDRVEVRNPVDVNIGDTIMVRPGERIPLDGIVVEGRAYVDTSALTGESLPKELLVGDTAISGCINTDGILKLKVIKEFSESTVSKILKLVESAREKKTQTEKYITKFAKYYTPIVVLGALLLTFLPPLLFGGNFSLWFSRALIFLVISCPCALVISVPLTFFAGIGGASRRGILVKGSCFIETLAKAEILVFDKTGTLTRGEFKVSEVVPVGNLSQEKLLEYAAYAECYSNHPIAQSIKAIYGKSIEEKRVKDIIEIPGKGLEAVVNNVKICIGNSRLMLEKSIKIPDINESGTVLYLALQDEYIGFIRIADTVKKNASSVISTLNKNGVKVVMLTGDKKETSEFVANKLGIDTFYYELLPEQKVEKVEELLEEKKACSSLVFVGDGINDAPVLTRADVGIAMGGLGSDAAIEAADVVIMDDDLSKIPLGINIAKKTLRIVKQNIVFSISIKVLFLILSVFGMMTMWGAIFADVGVTLIAILNSLRCIMGKV